MGILDFLFWFGGIIFSGGFLIHFIWTKNDEVISSRIGKLEDWLTDSPFRRRK